MTDVPSSDTPSPLILIIDDEPTQRLLTRDCLEREGFRVVEAADGDTGLQLMRTDPPDAVLLDLMMPGRDGYSVCAEVRSDKLLQHIPIIMVTGRDDPAAVERSFYVQATDFITKPVLWALLPHRLRFVIRTSRMKDDLRVALHDASAANRAKSQFIATMSHELRTPLNAIIGYAGLMKDEINGPLGNEKYREYIGDVHANGMDLLDIVNDIIDLVSIEAGKLTLSETEVSLGAMVSRVVRGFASQLSNGQITVENQVGDGAPIVMGDERRLTQLLVKLLSNAVKFTQAGGRIELRYETLVDGSAAVVISDTGCGIDWAELPRIMEPFQQLDNRLSREHNGCGLGIPIAAALAKLHGGELRYDTGVTVGTTVRLVLPAVRLLANPNDLDAASRRFA